LARRAAAAECDLSRNSHCALILSNGSPELVEGCTKVAHAVHGMHARYSANIPRSVGYNMCPELVEGLRAHSRARSCRFSSR
jgi:hypothetical protein